MAPAGPLATQGAAPSPLTLLDVAVNLQHATVTPPVNSLEIAAMTLQSCVSAVSLV